MNKIQLNFCVLYDCNTKCPWLKCNKTRKCSWKHLELKGMLILVNKYNWKLIALKSYYYENFLKIGCQEIEYPEFTIKWTFDLNLKSSIIYHWVRTYIETLWFKLSSANFKIYNLGNWICVQISCILTFWNAKKTFFMLESIYWIWEISLSVSYLLLWIAFCK